MTKKVKEKKITNSKALKVVFGVLLAIGATITIFCYIALKNEEKFRENSKETTATVTEVDKKLTSEGDSIYDISLKYEINGKVYYEEIENTYNIMSTGETITIRYNKNNPRDIRLNSSNLVYYLYLIIGVIFIVGSIILLLIQLKEDNKTKKLIANGDVIEAKVEKILKKEFTKICFYSILCSYKENNYISRKTLFDLEKIYKLGNKKVKVYIDKKNTENYYVDIDDYMNRKEKFKSDE